MYNFQEFRKYITLNIIITSRGLGVAILQLIRKKEEHRSTFKIDMNGMPIQPIHDFMSIEYAINGIGLLIPLKVDTMVVMRWPTNQ